MKIHVFVKSVYGIEKIYPACEKAENFCAIAGDKTLTDKTIRYVKNIGYEIVQIPKIHFI
jgi:hypothetical protein